MCLAASQTSWVAAPTSRHHLTVKGHCAQDVMLTMVKEDALLEQLLKILHGVFQAASEQAIESHAPTVAVQKLSVHRAPQPELFPGPQPSKTFDPTTYTLPPIPYTRICHKIGVRVSMIESTMGTVLIQQWVDPSSHVSVGPG